MAAKDNASKLFFAVAALLITSLMLFTANVSGFFDYVTSDTENYMIAEDGSYVICGGEKYIPAGDGFELEFGEFEILEEYVRRENADFIDNFFIYGYVIYGSAEDDSVIYVHTAESADSATGYYVKESLADAVTE